MFMIEMPMPIATRQQIGPVKVELTMTFAVDLVSLKVFIRRLRILLLPEARSSGALLRFFAERISNCMAFGHDADRVGFRHFTDGNAVHLERQKGQPDIAPPSSNVLKHFRKAPADQVDRDIRTARMENLDPLGEGKIRMPHG